MVVSSDVAFSPRARRHAATTHERSVFAERYAPSATRATLAAIGARRCASTYAGRSSGGEPCSVEPSEYRTTATSYGVIVDRLAFLPPMCTTSWRRGGVR